MKADIFFLGKLGGERLTGFYSMAIQLATIPLDKIGTIFNEVAFPAISRMQDDPEQAKTLFLNMHKYLLTVSLPLLIGLAFVAPDLVPLVLGEKWSPIIIPLQLFSLINILRLSGMIMIPVLQGLDQANKVLRYSAWCLALLPGAFFLGASHGIIGIMAAWALGYPLVYFYLVGETLKALEINWSEFILSVATPVITGAIMGVSLAIYYTIQLPSNFAWLRLVVAILIGGLACISSYLLIFRHEVGEILAGIKQFRNAR